MTTSQTLPQEPTVLFQDRKDGRPRRQRLVGWLGEIRCDTPEDWQACLDEIEACRDAGEELAGFVSYEAGYLLEPSLRALMPGERDVPLLWFGRFERCEETGVPEAPSTAGHESGPQLQTLEAALTPRLYEDKIRSIKALIEAGDIYQANFTYQNDLSLKGHPRTFFDRVLGSHPVPYAAFLETGKETVLSFSPELFFETSKDRIRARPMKGTAARGRTLAEDEDMAQRLAADPKERAENLMILDLMRNDLSRLAKPGTVTVPSLFAVERYPSVLQMTSTVEATLREAPTFGEVLKALFPCGSVTGAPKVRAMEVIQEHETRPRGVYCGAIGRIGKDAMTFNVAIRTLTVKARAEASQSGEALWSGVAGVGGGIVYDSTPEREWAECQLKLRYLTRKPQPAFSLIETFRLDPDGRLSHLERHLARLAASAAYFDFPCNLEEIRASLLGAAEERRKNEAQVLRLSLSPRGTLTFHERALSLQDGRPWSIQVATTRTDSQDPFLFHKTTHRAPYDEALAEAQSAGFDEAIFLNERGELTEGCITNLFLEREGILMTPPVECGLLPGTLRAELIEAGRAVERILTLDDLGAAASLFVGNSVRGLIPATLERRAPQYNSEKADKLSQNSATP